MDLITMLDNKYDENLSRKEIYDLIKKYKNGDNEAYKKIVCSNIKLVVKQVDTVFNTVEYDKEELISIGIIGLIKSIKTFDISEYIEFYYYATKCINNEIKMFLRRLNKIRTIDSLDRVISEDEYGNEVRLQDTILEDEDYILSLLNKEEYDNVRKIIETLKERERIIIELYFGINNNKSYKQKEIASMFNCNQSYVSRLVKRTLKKIKKELIEKDIIELNNRTLAKRVEK